MCLAYVSNKSLKTETDVKLKHSLLTLQMALQSLETPPPPASSHSTSASHAFQIESPMCLWNKLSRRTSLRYLPDAAQAPQNQKAAERPLARASLSFKPDLSALDSTLT